MYLDYYNLKVKPFQITADPKFLWLGEKHKEALATLRYGIIDNRGFLLLTGEVGTGKTLLINRLVTMLDIDTVVATLPDPDLVSMDFYNLLADGFKMDRTFDSKGAFLIHLRDFLHQSYAKHQQVLLIIDESQRLNHRLMEDIRVLSNIELHDRKLINIFFVGQQEFNSILMTPQNRALAQRITVRYHIDPLDEKEIADYIGHRLKIAGADQQLFKRSAIEEVYKFSGGIPRLINIICDHGLLTGYARGLKQIDDKIIVECAEELRIPLHKAENTTTGDQSNKQMPNTMAIANASARAQRSDAAQLRAPGTDSDGPHDNEQALQPFRSTAWKFAYAGMVLMLILIVAFAITHFARNDQPRWDAEDLTPQKYRTSLEKEKALLADRLQTDGRKAVDGATDALGPLAGGLKGKGDEPSGGKGGADENTLKANPSGKRNGAEANNSTVSDSAPSTVEDWQSISEAGGGEIEPLPLIKEKIIINFNINSNEINAKSYAVLDRIAAYLKDHPNETVYIRGYTDTSGSLSYNESVSRFRANTVKSYLIGKGADPENIKIFAMADKNPVATNDTLDGRRLNRRVEIEFPQNHTN